MIPGRGRRRRRPRPNCFCPPHPCLSRLETDQRHHTAHARHAGRPHGQSRGRLTASTEPGGRPDDDRCPDRVLLHIPARICISGWTPVRPLRLALADAGRRHCLRFRTDHPCSVPDVAGTVHFRAADRHRFRILQRCRTESCRHPGRCGGADEKFFDDEPGLFQRPHAGSGHRRHHD